MSKHTPGPWTINAHSDLISDKDGNILAYLRCTKTTSVGNGWLPRLANARLMAAAPEMFECLDAIMGFDSKANYRARRRAYDLLKELKKP